MTTRTELINHLIKRFKYERYLEIGVSEGECFKAVQCAVKVGVDPDESTPATYHCTSDDFFEINKMEFDIVFIDGLHEERQVMLDAFNSLTRLRRGGLIILHDVNPQEEIHQRVPRESKTWNGDVWKAWMRLASMGFYGITVDIDHGCGVLFPYRIKPFFAEEPINWDGLVKNRELWLNLMSTEDFLEEIEKTVNSNENNFFRLPIGKDQDKVPE